MGPENVILVKTNLKPFLCPQPTYQNTSLLRETKKVAPVDYSTTQTTYTSHSPGYNSGSNQSTYNASQNNYSSPQPGYGSTRSDRSGRGNLTELDTLLDDLSNARYGNYVDKSTTYSERNGEFIVFFYSLLSSFFWRGTRKIPFDDFPRR